MRSILFNAVRDVENDTHKAMRYLWTDHVSDSISQFEPYVTKYGWYRALPVPKDGDKYGTYNLIMTEHYWLINPFSSANGKPRNKAFREITSPEFTKLIGAVPMDSDIDIHGDADALRESPWPGDRDQDVDVIPPMMICLPLFWEDDLKGNERTMMDGYNYRWVTVWKYPEGVSEEEGDKWFFETLVPELQERPEVRRMLTSKVIHTGIPTPFHRVVEFWFEDANAWREAIVNAGKEYTKPEWATSDSFPFVKPVKDFVGIFLMDTPDADHLRQFRGVLTTR